MLLRFLPIVLIVPISIGFISNKETTAEKEFQKVSSPKIGPKGMPYNKTTSCDKFGQYARFNPDSVVGAVWFVFYYWATPQTTIMYEFKTPSKQDMKLLHFSLDGHLPSNFSWTSKLVIMRNVVSNVTFLLEEKGDRGQYRAYTVVRNIPENTTTEYKDIRIRQTGDNKYLGIMHCKTRTAFIMSRLSDIPPQHKIQDEAAKLGIRSRKGKSYLYQGHEWMPIPEMDEIEFWNTNKIIKQKFGNN